LKCAECGDVFLSTHALIDHMSAEHDGKKPHQCQKCGKTFGILSNLNSHTEEFSCHNFWSKPVVIKLNNIKDTGSLVQGKPPSSNKPTVCDICEKNCQSHYAMNLHIATVHEGKRPYQCTECERKFGTSSNLNTHLRKKHQQFDLSKLRNGPKTSFLPVHEKKKPAKLGNGPKNNIPSDSSSEQMGFISDHEETTPLAKFRKSPTKNNILSTSSTNEELSSFLPTVHEKAKPHLPHLKPHLCSECGKQFETRDRFNTHLRKKHSIEICEVKKRRKKYCHNNMRSEENSEQFLPSHRAEKSDEVHEKKKRKIDFEFSENYIKTMTDNSPDNDKSDVSTVHEKKRRPYECDICGKDFKTLNFFQRSLNAHLRDSHRISKKSDKKQLKLSNENVKKSEEKMSKPFSCEICGKKLTTNTNMVIHMAYAHDGPKPYNCSKCGKKFAIKFKLDEHLKCEKSNCYKGVIEEKSAKINKNNNIRHKPRTARPKLAVKNAPEVSEDNAKIHECPKCGKKFEKLMSLKGHILRSNSCREEILKNPEGLQFTKPVDDSVKKYDCPGIECDRKFGTKSNLRLHISKKHPKSYEEYLSKNNITTKIKNRVATGKRLKKPYFCADCGDRFLGKFALLDHINAAHDGKKPHSCGKCGKRFGILSNLNVHLRRNSCKVDVEEIRQKSFTTVIKRGAPKRRQKTSGGSCKDCGTNFESYASLTYHISTVHEEKKPNECPNCGRFFAINSSISVMKMNVMRHLHLCGNPKPTSRVERVFYCSLCPKRFFKESYIKLHIKRIHEKKRPYKCTTCEKKFVTWSNWTRHLAIHMGCKKFAKNVQKAVPVQKLRFIHRNGRKLVCKYDDARVRLVLENRSVNGLYDKFLPFYS